MTFHLTEEQVEQNVTESERINLAAAESARAENESPGGMYYREPWAENYATEPPWSARNQARFPIHTDRSIGPWE